ncbi:diacylglycerol kinase [Bacterioplanoides sp. SCSIO 12839]|uniref:diacylglycerol kinase n=1 Tax=Bacterioplanoides sp. SCSIO 12839 TaxID=2829569 RepID=UPI002103FB2E|nr:diacylglycerol kinase family protein [Bacterioplanoides sp. SCSIO 12839]UTW49887.1 diacylglycerol kinase family protein [Bacterioplanoides sp. SCSIO 12839]
MSWLKTRLASFIFAFRGLKHLFASEAHAQIHLLAAVAVVVAAFATGVSTSEWLALVFAIVLVMAMEALNTALEALADALHPGHHPLVGKAKDVAAAAVLLCAFAAVIVACLVFLPHWL